MMASRSGADPAYRCLICGHAMERDVGLCSTHCRADADMELRHNRRLRVQLRHSDGHGSREVRRLLERDADLRLALLNSAPALNDLLHGGDHG